MSELIKITESKKGQVVSARELHKFLEAGSNMNTWFKNQTERAMLDEGTDFIQISEQSNGGRPSIDYAINLSSAKEIAMLNGGEKGKEARQYFIACENQLKLLSIPSYQIDDPIARAKSWIVEQEKTLLLQQENKKLQFRSDFVDVCFDTDGVFAMEEVSKILKLPYGRNTMLAKLRDKKAFLSSNTPKQSLINSGYFKVMEQLIETNSKFRKIISTTYATQKGIGYIHKILKE